MSGPERAPALNEGGDGVIICGVILAYHLIFSCYGFWLPNDPRGSWSEEVRRYELLRFGPAAKVTTRRSVAGVRHDFARRDAAKKALKYPPVVFDGRQARAAARGFAEVCSQNGYAVYACAVMADHVHLVVARHGFHTVEQIARRLKAKATQRLNKEDLGFGRTPWAVGEWKVFLDSPRAIRRTIRYVDRNPISAGFKRQVWKFVAVYDGG